MMWGLRFIQLLFFMVKIPSSREVSYIASLPKIIKPGMPFKIHVKLVGSRYPTNVVANVKSMSGTQMLSVQKNLLPGTLTEMSLKTPREMKRGKYKLKLVGRGGVNFQTEKLLSCLGSDPFSLIQMDRGMYAEMEKIQSRIIALYPSLKPYCGDVNIKIYDSKNRLIFQTLNKSMSNGVTEQTFRIPGSPNLGTWKIEAEVKKNVAEKTFVVRKYVVPKFKVSITCNKATVDSSTRSLTCTVRTRFTSGKSLKGTFRFQAVTRNGNMNKFLKNEYGDIAGAKVFKMSWTRPSDVTNDIEILAQVGDKITGTTVSASQTVRYRHQVVNEWELEPKIQSFKPGLPLKVYLKFSSPKAQAPFFQVIQFKRTTKMCTLAPQAYRYKTEWTFGESVALKLLNGYGVLDLRPDSNVYKIDLIAYKGRTKKKLTIPTALTRNGKFLSMIPTQGFGKVGKHLQIQIKSTELLTNSLSYQVISQNQLVEFGEIKCRSTRYLTTSFKVKANWYPRATIVVTHLSNSGHILADSQDYEILGAPFMNYVTLKANITKAKPKEKVRFDIGAMPGSRVYLLSIDEGVESSQEGYDVTTQDVTEAISQGLANNEIVRESMADKNIRGPLRYYERAGLFVASNQNLQEHPTVTSSLPTVCRNPCSPNPCGNGGKCRTYNKGKFYCTCTARYEGTTCKRRKMRVQAAGWRVRFAYARPASKKPMMLPDRGQSMPGTSIRVFGLVNQGRTTSKAPSLPAGNPVLPPPLLSKKLSDLKEYSKRLWFPNTWIWDVATIRKDSNKAMYDAIIPDSMTTWVTTAFSINEKHGIGFLEHPHKITVSKDFFVELSLPKTANGGSNVAVRISLFNNLDLDMFALLFCYYGQKMVESTTSTVKAGGNSVRHLGFKIPKGVTGKENITVVAYSAFFQVLDYVQMTIIIKPPGLEQEYNIPKIITASGVNLIKLDPVKLTYPTTVVKGTKRVYVTLTGDALAPSIDGLESLLRLPTGCGEQTMLSLAPNIYILKYLTVTRQLSATFENKAISYINKGKDRELTWRRTDGSFSVWGNRDRHGSTWLTAFVMTCFHQALKSIDIEDDIFEGALGWLLTRQQSDGSFAELGRVIHYDMKGGVHAEKVTMASYILLTLLENDDIPSLKGRIARSKGKVISYILNQQRTLHRNKHGLALTAYALLKAGRANDARTLFNVLEQSARKHDGFLYWTYGSGYSWRASRIGNSWSCPNPRARSIDIETTAYALLYLTLKGDVGRGMAILKWLVSQRNPNGGFSSTQDTVVSLHALSEFVSMKDKGGPTLTNLAVDVTSLNGHGTSLRVNKFTVNDLNRKLVQRTPEFEGDVSSIQINAKGNGFAVVDIVVKYNVETIPQNEAFGITTNVPKSKQTFDSITVNVCVRRKQNVRRNGMVVTEVGVPCGFKGDLSKTANNNPRYLKNTETGFDKVVLYFDRIGAQNVCFDVVAERVDKVTQSEAIPVVAYDYYEPVYQGWTNYTSGVLEQMSLCDVCKTCTICQKTTIGR